MMTIPDTTTPVTILRAAAHGPLGILRSLGRLGVPVYVVDGDARVPAFTSRYCRGRFVCDVGGPAAGTVEALLRIGRSIGRRSILIPTTDDGALFVATHAAALRESFWLTDLAPGLVGRLCSKRGMHALAREVGVPTAHAVFPRDRHEVHEFLRTAAFPVMLKGIDGVRLQERAGARMFIVRTADELLARYDALEDPAVPNLMLQEYIPGGDDTVWMFNGYFDARSECLIGFTGKKLRQHPVHRGSTSLGVCLRNDAVAALTTRFMRAIGYRGILDIGYRYDARDGQYKVLDVNPRLGATFRLFVAENGLDVVRALYLDVTGQPVPVGAAREGRTWLVEDFDLLSCVRYWREGELGLRAWMRSLRGIDEAAYFARDDLRPLLKMCVVDATEIVQRLYAKGRRWVAGAAPAPRMAVTPGPGGRSGHAPTSAVP